MRKIKQCTKENPYTKERDEKDCRWSHDNAHEVGDQRDGYPGGDLVIMKCDNCGVTWEMELPQ